MITVTAADWRFMYTNQDIDERGAVLRDLRRTPWDYFGHPDAGARAYAKDTWLAWRMGEIGNTALPMVDADVKLHRLYQRLRVLAVLEEGVTL